MPEVDPPLAILAELTHRCPLQCPYCSNPLELERAREELDTDTWRRVLDQAASMGVLQVHFSGGEPMARRDLEELVAHAARAGLYTNLVTSGVLLSDARADALVEAGLDHVQVSFQDVDDAAGDRIAGYEGAQRLKREAAARVRERDLPLTINAVMHRQNLSRLPEVIEQAVELGAGRLEVAHVQYYGWALANRDALLPTRAQLDEATAIVEAARERLRGRLVIDYVVPDYHAMLPKSCMGGWARRFLNVTPSGKALPCHAAETLPGLAFPSVRTMSLDAIWRGSEAFNRFRGTDWMMEPCRSCDRREIDWGGCRCQAFALTGNPRVADPVCHLAPDHLALEPALRAAEAAPPPLIYRRIGGSTTASDEAVPISAAPP
ncbi:MAG TPA: pyrroloquinoline quinone biosynthesis protein PqqE [Stellaceae bacterium]|jgi:pyrroloquinoline quinone biosynthesis protein E|nr:pyrroloquinoline quinone biosynthesis protein PqqE [Stellaceae bacterium]